jgi:hypothetical protein
MPIEVDRWIDSIIQKVQELPERTSPDARPELMMVTDKELRLILEDACTEINLAIE